MQRKLDAISLVHFNSTCKHQSLRCDTYLPRHEECGEAFIPIGLMEPRWSITQRSRMNGTNVRYFMLSSN